MSETRKSTAKPSPIDTEAINRAFADLGESLSRMRMGFTARTVFGLVYAGNPDAARETFERLDVEQRAKVAEAARLIVAIAEETPAPGSLLDPRTW